MHQNLFKETQNNIDLTHLRYLEHCFLNTSSIVREVIYLRNTCPMNNLCIKLKY